MDITVTDGLDIVSIGYNHLGSYYKLKKPVSLIWSDCAGSVGQYLSLIPSSPEERELLQNRINNNLDEDFTGQEEALYELLKPLFKLFRNGEYALSYVSGYSENNLAGAEFDGKPKTYVMYPEPVEIDKVEEIKRKYRHKRHSEDFERLPDDLVSFTSTSFYDWSNDFYIATRPKSEMDVKRIDFFENKILGGGRPFIIILDALYAPEHNYSGMFILDGHHKLEAYLKLGLAPSAVYITRKIDGSTAQEFDIESLALSLYPWQFRHVLDNWDEKNSELPKLAQKPNSRLLEFIRHGNYEEYHDNGKLKHKGYYIYDRPEGLISEYFESGRPKSEKRYRNHIVVGTWKTWYSNGTL